MEDKGSKNCQQAMFRGKLQRTVKSGPNTKTCALRIKIGKTQVERGEAPEIGAPPLFTRERQR